jgi:alcohol dehydrogenase class IV
MTDVALFTDGGLLDSSYMATVTESLKAVGITFQIFSDIRIEPDDFCVEQGAAFIKSGQFDGMISVGGGSVIDTAKAAVVCAKHESPLGPFFAKPIGEGKAITAKLLPHIACPTTSGTGSECTSIAVVRIRELDTKFVIASPLMLPDQAVIDPECCDTLPTNVIASTGFDLLSHALECYTAKAYTQWAPIDNPNARPLIQGANPWSDLAATKALEIAGEYLNRAVNDTSDQEARDQLMWGAALAGMAFGNSGTHMPHAMSYGVTHLMRNITTEGYDVKTPFVPHGVSVIVTAPACFRYTAEATPERHLEAAGFLKADQQGAGLEDAGEVLSKRMIELMQQTHMPNGLSGVGFGSADIKAMAASSVRQARAIANAPRESNLVDLENIYADAISYW